LLITENKTASIFIFLNHFRSMVANLRITDLMPSKMHRSMKDTDETLTPTKRSAPHIQDLTSRLEQTL